MQQQWANQSIARPRLGTVHVLNRLRMAIMLPGSNMHVVQLSPSGGATCSQRILLTSWLYNVLLYARAQRMTHDLADGKHGQRHG